MGCASSLASPVGRFVLSATVGMADRKHVMSTKVFSDEISYGDNSVAFASLSPAQQRAERDRADLGLNPEIAAPPVPKPIGSQEREVVCALGAQRAATDERIAKSLGFSPKPPVFEIGTVVNSVGVDNFRRSRLDWDAQPSLPELARTFSNRIAAERRSDVKVDTRTLAMLANGNMTIGGQVHLISERAVDGLATHVTPGGAGYLRACPPDLRADNLNYWLSTARKRDAKASKAAGHDVYKGKELTLRTRARKAGAREVYAACGPSYASFDVDRVAREAAAAIGGDARGVVTYDGYRMTLDAMFHSNIAPEHAVAGEFFKGTVRVQAADDGSGAVKVKLGLWRNLCRNLIIVDFDTVLIGSRRHVGQTTIEADIRALMQTANERIGLIVGKWSEASTENVLERYDLTDVEEVFRGLVLNDCVAAPGVTSDEMVTRLHNAWQREPGYSKTAFLNAITRAAHEESWQSWSDTEDLESQAGALLYQKVWNLDTSKYSAEELLA